MSILKFQEDEGVVFFENHSFQKALREDKLNEFVDQRNLQTPLDQVLWILWVMQDRFGHQLPLLALEISNLLEIRGIALTDIQVQRALARAGARVSRKQFEGNDKRQSAYKLMQKGRDYLVAKYAKNGGVHAFVVDGKKPWTDRHVTIRDLAKNFSGPVSVLDKFYASASLEVLHHFGHARPLRFLTARTNESHAAFLRELRDFKKEVPTIEVRVYPNGHELHDRYIITRDAVIIVGHGIKDLGAKESVVLILNGEVGRDMRRILQEKFDERWAKAKPIV